MTDQTFYFEHRLNVFIRFNFEFFSFYCLLLSSFIQNASKKYFISIRGLIRFNGQSCSLKLNGPFFSSSSFCPLLWCCFHFMVYNIETVAPNTLAHTKTHVAHARLQAHASQSCNIYTDTCLLLSSNSVRDFPFFLSSPTASFFSSLCCRRGFFLFPSFSTGCQNAGLVDAS